MTTLDALQSTSPESRRTRTELTELTGLCDRAVREQIESMRKKKKVHIIADTNRAGYYIAENTDEWNRAAKRHNRQMIRSLWPIDRTYGRQIAI